MDVTDYISYTKHYSFALGTFVMTGVKALTYGIDPHPCWDTKFRWRVPLRHILGESACRTDITKARGCDLLHLYQKAVTTLTMILYVISQYLHLSHKVNVHTLHLKACEGKQRKALAHRYVDTSIGTTTRGEKGK